MDAGYIVAADDHVGHGKTAMVNNVWGDWGDKGPHTMMEDEHTLKGIVCEKYPDSKQLTHKYTYYDSGASTQMLETHVFTLEANDAGYTLPIPQEVLDFNTGMINNERPWREHTVTTPKD